jgi:Putative phage serine protease XkdF
MSVELFSPDGELGQFASSDGYSDLIAASQKDPVLKKFFDDANTEDTAKVASALNKLKSSDDVEATAKGLADLMKDQNLVYISNGTYDKNDEDVNKSDVVLTGTIVKLDRVQHLVFGWASIVTVDGKEICDTQGDIISSMTMEDAAYDFVLTARKGGDMHQTSADGTARGVSRLVESIAFTREKQLAMVQSLHDQGITNAVVDLCCEGWWIGFYVDNPGTWARIESGELKAFSIGGKGKRDDSTDIVRRFTRK